MKQNSVRGFSQIAVWESFNSVFCHNTNCCVNNENWKAGGLGDHNTSTAFRSMV